MSGDGIEVRLRSYSTPCDRCAALRARGAAHVSGAVLLRDGVAHLCVGGHGYQVELCRVEVRIQTPAGEITVRADPALELDEFVFERAQRSYADLCAAAIAMACSSPPPPATFTRPPPRRHYSRRERRRRRSV